MMIKDRNIEWARGKLYIPVTNMTGISLVDGASEIGDGGAMQVTSVVSSLDVHGLPLDTGTADDGVAHHAMVPYYWDPDQELGFRVCWASSGTTVAEGATFDILFDIVASGAAMIDAVTALDTALVESNQDDTAWGTTWSARGIKNKNWATQAQVDAGAFYTLSIILDAHDITEDDVILHGLLIDYGIKMCDSSRAY